jgi:WbqC-like protein
VTTLAVLQPGYLPWLGFFDQLMRSDVFVMYDDVQFDKHGWRNRNRVKSPQGPVWLTVPVLHKGLGWQKILDVKVNNETAWGRKHLATIRQLYARAPHLDRYVGVLEAMLSRSWEFLVDLDLALIQQMAAWLGVTTKIVRSSELPVDGDRSSRLLHFCQHFGAQRYLSGSAARDYLDVPLFESNGIAVDWQDYRHPVYPQQHGEFVPYLSAIDLLFNCGEESARVLSGPGVLEEQ